MANSSYSGGVSLMGSSLVPARAPSSICHWPCRSCSIGCRRASPMKIGQGYDMRRRVLGLAAAVMALGALLAPPAQAQQQITGAGSTFVYPVLAKWSAEYAKSHGVQINYQSIGSGGGIAQIKAGTVDFGATDAPLSPADLQAAGLLQFPVVIGGIVPVVNIPGVKAGDIKLSGPLLADIYLGKIKKWN